MLPDKRIINTPTAYYLREESNEIFKKKTEEKIIKKSICPINGAILVISSGSKKGARLKITNAKG